MSKRHTLTLHQIITVYNDMFYHIDCVMRAWAKKKTPGKEDLFFAVKLVQQKLSKYYAEVTPSTCMRLMSAHILDPCWKLQSFRKCDKRMDSNPEYKTSYTTQYQDAFLKYVGNECSAKHRPVQVNKHESLTRSNLIPSETVLGSCQLSFDPYELSSDDEEYLTPNNVAETTPGRSDCAALVLAAAWPI